MSGDKTVHHTPARQPQHTASKPKASPKPTAAFNHLKGQQQAHPTTDKHKCLTPQGKKDQAQEKAGHITQDTLKQQHDATSKNIAAHYNKYDTNHDGLDHHEFEKAFRDNNPLKRNDAQKHADGDVKALQSQLNHANNAKPGDHNYVKVDGYYGPKTENAVKDFQKKNNLDPTGHVNGNTQAALDPAPKTEGSGNKPQEKKNDPNAGKTPAEIAGTKKVADELHNFDPKANTARQTLDAARKNMDADHPNANDARALAKAYGQLDNANAADKAKEKGFNALADGLEHKTLDGNTAKHLTNALRDDKDSSNDIKNALHDSAHMKPPSSKAALNTIADVAEATGVKGHDGKPVADTVRTVAKADNENVRKSLAFAFDGTNTHEDVKSAFGSAKSPADYAAVAAVAHARNKSKDDGDLDVHTDGYARNADFLANPKHLDGLGGPDSKAVQHLKDAINHGEEKHEFDSENATRDEILSAGKALDPKKNPQGYKLLADFARANGQKDAAGWLDSVATTVDKAHGDVPQDIIDNELRER